MKITKLTFWKKCEFDEDSLFVPNVRGDEGITKGLEFPLVYPFDAISSPFDRLFSAIHIVTPFHSKNTNELVKYNDMIKIRYMHIEYYVGNDESDNDEMYGWVKDISLISDSDKTHFAVIWRPDFWRTYLKDVTFGYGFVERRPILPVEFKLYDYLAQYRYPEKYVEFLPIYKKLITVGVTTRYCYFYWVCMTFMGKRDVGKNVETLIMVSFPVSSDVNKNTLMRFKKSNDKGEFADYIECRAMSLTQVMDGTYYQEFEVEPSAIKLLGVSFVAPVAVKYVNESGAEDYFEISVEDGIYSDENVSGSIVDSIKKFEFKNGGYYVNDIFISFSDEDFASWLTFNWDGGDKKETADASGRRLIISETFKTQKLIDILNQYCGKFIKLYNSGRVKLLTGAHVNHYKYNYFVNTLVGDSVVFKRNVELIKSDISNNFVWYNGQWFIDDTGLIPITANDGYYFDVNEAESINFMLECSFGVLSTIDSKQTTNKYGYLRANFGYWQCVASEISGDKKDLYVDVDHQIVMVDYDGEIIKQFPRGFQFTTYDYEVISSSANACLRIRFGCNKYPPSDAKIGGSEVLCPLISLDIIENALDAYNLSGKRRYDLELKKESALQALVGGVTSSITGVASGALLGQLSVPGERIHEKWERNSKTNRLIKASKDIVTSTPESSKLGAIGGGLLTGGLGFGSALLQYGLSQVFNDRMQKEYEVYVAQQADNVIIPGSSTMWLNHYTYPCLVRLVKDEYSILCNKTRIKYDGIEAKEHYDNCTSLIERGGAMQIKNLEVNGYVPDAPISYIKMRFSKGVYLV